MHISFRKMISKNLYIKNNFRKSVIAVILDRLELGLSTSNNIKNNKQERLWLTEEEMKVCLLHIQPKIEEIVKKHARHRFHTK